jgi:hypothetical protein
LDSRWLLRAPFGLWEGAVADPFDTMCRAAGRRILADLTTEERAANELDLTDPVDVCCYVAGMLTVERQSFSVTLADIDARLKQLAWGSS